MAEARKIKDKSNVTTKSSLVLNSDKLTDDELLEQIMKKKANKKKNIKNKQNTSNSKVKKTTSKKSSSSKKKIVDNSINDEIYEQIKNKSKKKTSKNKKQIVDKPKVIDSDSDDYVLDKNKTLEEIEAEQEKLYKEQELVVIPKYKEKIKDDAKSVAKEHIEKDLNNCQEKINSAVPKQKEVTKKSKEDLIITREINFNTDFSELKEEGVLEELKSAIEEFDKLDDCETKFVDDPTIDVEFDNVKKKKLKNKNKQKNKNKGKKVSKTNESKDEASSKLISNIKDKTKKEIDDTKTSLTKVKEKLTKPKSIFGDSVIYDNNEDKKLILLLLSFLLIGVLVVIIWLDYSKVKSSFAVQPVDKQTEIKDKYEALNKCIATPVTKEEVESLFKEDIDALNKYLDDNYEASVLYTDLTTDIVYGHNEDVVYYAASTIKALDALYIYTKAASGEINLNDSLVYTKNDYRPSSKFMSKKKYGERIKIKDLVKYAIVVSDNTAHQMLIEYIGRDKLRNFGKSLGTGDLLRGDNFGNITVNDATIIMKEINKFINDNGLLGLELKGYFTSAEQNSLAIPDKDIEAAHKYGEYKYYYHDIGIVYDEHPYVIAILTKEGNKKNFQEIVSDINYRVYEIHRKVYDNHENVCKLKVYGTVK